MMTCGGKFPLLEMYIFDLNCIRSTPRFHRTMTRPFFVRDRITDFNIFDNHAIDAINQAKSRLSQGYPIDFQVRVHFYRRK